MPRVCTINVKRGKNLVLLNLVYAYDAAGNVKSLNNTVAGTSELYSFDALNRLVFSSGPWPTLQYGYDQVGNRAWMTSGGTNTTYSYIPGQFNRLNSTGPTRYTYDNDGNVKTQTTGRSTTSYTYDYENRLVKVVTGSSTLGAYAYTPTGMKILAVESGTTTVSLNSGVNVLYEKKGSTINDYVYADGLLIARISGGNQYYYHQDHLGNTRLVTLGSNTSFSSNYEPYGQQYAVTGTDPEFKYTGKPQSVTGLYYYAARWYNQSLGRFLSRDPNPGRLSNPQSLNLYVYVLNNPLRYTDPTGTSSCAWYDVVCGWNNLSGQQQAWIFTAVVITIAVVAVVATGGIDTPLVAAAVGAALSSGTYTVAAGDKATFRGAVTYAAIGALLGGAGAAVGGGSAATTTGLNLVERATVNGAIGAGFNSISYGIQLWTTGQAFSWSGLAGAAVTGFVGGALGTKGAAVSEDTTSLSQWAIGNAVAGVGGYVAGQAVQGKAPTVGGLLETGGFSIFGGAISDTMPSEIRGAIFAGAVGLTQPFNDIWAGYQTGWSSWPNLVPLF